MKTKILIVDDEDDILELLKYNLEKENYSVITAKNGFEALQKIELKPNLIILDLMMPIIDGLETLKKIKEKDEYKDIPVIFLTAKTSESSEIAGLNSGASDFLLKPVSINKLLARIKAHLRRYTEKESISSTSIIEIEGLKIDPEKFIVTINSQPVEFSKTEFLILLLLASKRGRVFKRSNILDQVWGDNVYVTERTVDVHLLKIRKKLGEYAYLIETVKGIGYRFKDE
ncbi:MAG: response regulator transcription factor [Ignavibacteriales bacterium]|jgi:two-component system alkaline phosphatase synthesis response regulator PhoP|nr:response regulator transcription factor [Ignavibacteriales bacterium]